VLSHPRFAAGDYDTHFLSQEFRAGQLRSDNELSRREAAILCTFLEEQTAGSAVEPFNEADPHTTANGWTLLRLDAMRR